MENCGDFREFMQLLLRRRVPMGYMLAGSVAELPVQYVITNLTDFDHMNFPLTLCAVSPTDPFPVKFHGDVLLVETNNAYPGFARLKYCDNSGAYFKRWQLLQSSSPGPARKGTFMSLIELNNLLSREEKRRFQKQLQKYEITTVDYVSCVVCPIWPTAALEWIRRQRNNGWPTKELLSKVVHGGCHFVAKAHPSCPNDGTLFRFSFSSAEIVLVNSWSAVQKYIYHILRLIKNNVEKQCNEKRLESAIFSYTMKTLMLWACEVKPPSFWNKSSITDSVTELVSELIEWLIEGGCQNYFIPNNNMFEHPTGDVDLTIQILLPFVCNESKIEKITKKWPIANPDVYFPLAVSDKLSLLAQFGVNRVSHFINPVEPNSDNSVSLDQLAADGLELSQLVTGLNSNFQAAINKREHQTYSNSELLRTARNHLDQSMRTAPQTSSQTFVYFGKSVFENLPYLVGRKQPDLHRTCIYTRDEETIIQIAVNGQKGNKEQVPSGLDMATAIAVNFCIQGVDKSIPKASYFASAAYRANFCFTYLEKYEECLSICKEAGERYSALQKRIGICDYCDHVCSVVLTSKWSVIFDECIQTVFGFILLHDHCLSRQEPETRKSVLESKNSFVIYISPMAFIRYVANQCRVRLSRSLTSQDLVDQYLECSRLLLESVYNDQVVRLTTKSQKHLRTLSRAVAKDILNTNTA